jgi:hypothetical protein
MVQPLHLCSHVTNVTANVTKSADLAAPALGPDLDLRSGLKGGKNPKPLVGQRKIIRHRMPNYPPSQTERARGGTKRKASRGYETGGFNCPELVHPSETCRAL